MVNEVPQIFRDLAVVAARLTIWNKKFALPLEKLRGASLQKVSASDDGYLIMQTHRPTDGRATIVLSIRKQEAGIYTGERPPSQPKPNSIVQVMRKYLIGRRVRYASASIDPTAIVIEFDDHLPSDLDDREKLIAPDCLILDLDAKPVKVCVAKKYSSVPERYESCRPFFENGDAFYESFCEWSLDFTKTKRRPSFEKRLLEFCVLEGAIEQVSAQEPPKPFVPQVAYVEKPTEERKEPTINLVLLTFPTHVRRAIKTRMQFLERRIQRQKDDLPPEKELIHLEKRSETLRANLYMWPKGSNTWYVPANLIEEGLPPMLKLTAGMKPGDLLDEFFRQTEKIKKARRLLLLRIADSTRIHESFKQLILDAGVELEELLEAAPVSQFQKQPAVFSSQLPHAVKTLCELLEVAWTEGAQKRKRENEEEDRRLPFRSYKSSTGEFIRVSKSAADSDVMIKKMPGHHYWIHIMNGEGSHVWLETPKKGAPSTQAIKEAAILAIYHSKFGKGMEGEVRVTTRSNIEKKKDLPPGKVLVRRCETMVVRFNEPDLNKVLANAV